MYKALVGAVSAALLVSAAALPVTAKELKWAFQTDTTHLDPHGHNVTFSAGFLGNIYEGLVRRNEKLEIEPALATKWELVSPKVWRFHLRKGVKFHNGNDFNADDVVFTAARTLHDDSLVKRRMATVDKVVKIDDHTVEFHTSVPNPILTAEWENWHMMDKEWAEANGAVAPTNLNKGIESFAGRNANGTGPFKIVERTVDVKTVLVPNPDWWDTPVHNLTKVIMTPITQDATRVAALLSGEIDMMYPVPVQDINRVNANDGTSVTVGPELRTIFLLMDQLRDNLLGTEAKNPYKDIRVRQAVYHAINIEAIKKKIMRGLSDPSSIMISPKLFPKGNGIKRLAYDPAKAKALLADAGYPNGFTTRFDCPNDRYVNDEQICQAIVSMWAKVGIKANLTAQPKAKYFAQIGRPNRDFHIGLLGWTPGSFDSHNVLSNLHVTWNEKTSAGRFNYGDFSNARVDELTEMILVETDAAKRDAMILEAYTITTDNVYYVPLHQQALAWGKRDNIEMRQRADNQFRFYWVRVN